MSPIEILEAMQGKRIAVVGDPMVDHYIFGRVERICPEAPVPVFIPEREERRQGGASNVAAQINALGCRAISLMPQKVSVKTRYMAGHHLMLRVDQDAVYVPDSFDIEQVVQAIETRFYCAVVMSDYNRGWLSPAMVGAVPDATRAVGSPTIGDTKDNLYRFEGCSLLCPTEEEYSHELLDLEAFSAVLLKRGAKGMRLYEGGVHPGTDIPATARHVY